MKAISIRAVLTGILLYAAVIILQKSELGLYRFSMDFFKSLFSREEARTVFQVEWEEYVAVFGEDETEVFL